MRGRSLTASRNRLPALKRTETEDGIRKTSPVRGLIVGGGPAFAPREAAEADQADVLTVAQGLFVAPNTVSTRSAARVRGTRPSPPPRRSVPSCSWEGPSVRARRPGGEAGRVNSRRRHFARSTRAAVNSTKAAVTRKWPAGWSAGLVCNRMSKPSQCGRDAPVRPAPVAATGSAAPATRSVRACAPAPEHHVVHIGTGISLRPSSRCPASRPDPSRSPWG